MDVKVIPITDSTVLDVGPPAPKLGPLVMVMPEGPALCHDAFSCSAITGERPETGDKFVVLISVARIDGEAIGTLVQMTPDEARGFAASVMRGANDCDGGPQ